jgi:phosphoribosylformylglycinamidine cyclo-ligase
VVEKSRMLNGQKSVKRGDVVIGIESSGLHTNGYSLGRQIFFEKLKLKPTSKVAELGTTIGDALLATHITYGPLVQQLVKKFNKVGKPDAVKAFAHITGGGFVDNVPRTLPAKCDVVIRKGSWDMLPIFHIIAAKGGVDEAELYQVFNMGIGMTVTVAADQADAVLKTIKAAKHKAWIIGEVVKGTGICRVE